MSPSKAPRRFKELSLATTESVEKDERTGSEVRVTKERRGILVTETRHYDLTNLSVMETESPRDSLMRICESIRDRLEKSGIPSDREPVWVRAAEGEWRPRRTTDDAQERAGKLKKALWTSRMQNLTEPLSVERSAGNLLWALLKMLEMKGIDPFLWHIGQSMEKYVSFRMSGSVNHYAAIGIATARARAAGPEKKKKQGAERRLEIWEIATSYWNEHPAYQGDALNTASVIAKAVNDRLLAEGLLPKSGKCLSAKTIADHISAQLKV